MKKVMLSMLIAISALSMVATDADAKRVGGGGSFGRQSSNVSNRAAPATAPMANSAARPASPAAAPAPSAPAVKPPSPWRGVLGGALLGLGMGALLSHFGLGGAMGGMFGSILMLVLLAGVGYFIFQLFRRKSAAGMTPSASYGGAGAGNFDSAAPLGRSATPEIGSALQPEYAGSNTGSNTNAGFGSSALNAPVAQNTGTWGIPADFDVPVFLRNAKTYFIRLQAAWDKADLNDIREFTSTEMFAEFRLELQERGTSANVTDVVRLDAEMLGVETAGDDYLASVKFTGLIKEDPAADAVPFAEVWNLSKPVNGQGGWVLAGIQQLS